MWLQALGSSVWQHCNYGCRKLYIFLWFVYVIWNVTDTVDLQFMNG